MASPTTSFFSNAKASARSTTASASATFPSFNNALAPSNNACTAGEGCGAGASSCGAGCCDRYEEALRCYLQALPIQREVKDRRGEAVTLSNLMGVAQVQKMPGLAIFYGKQAVNVT